MKMKYNKLAINTPEALIFGNALYPVTTRRGLVIGGGRVIILIFNISKKIKKMNNFIEKISECVENGHEIIRYGFS